MGFLLHFHACDYVLWEYSHTGTNTHACTHQHTPLSFHILSCWYRSLFLILILSLPAPHQLLYVGENMSEWHQRSREVWYSSRCNNSAFDTDCHQARQSTLLWGKTSQEHFYSSNYYANNFRLVSSYCYGEKNEFADEYKRFHWRKVWPRIVTSPYFHSLGLISFLY